MLHVTNGDSAAEGIRQTGIPGAILSWRDFLHEGPVPAVLSLDAMSDVRARFIGERLNDTAEVRRQFAKRDETLKGFREHEEVVLWFEHDLYDQLQLLQVLDWLGGQERGDTRLTLINPPEYLGPASPERLKELFEARQAVLEAQVVLAQQAWTAFTAADPTNIQQLAEQETAALPFLGGALLRHLQQFPSVASGLSRSERQALEVLAEEPRSAGYTFAAAHQQQEDPIFLGDTIFAGYLQDLSGEPPLILSVDGTCVITPGHFEGWADFWSRPLKITSLGREVLRGEADRVRMCGLDKWLGGVHLTASGPIWRWDEASQKLVKPPGYR